jgi:hypothetical protein
MIKKIITLSAMILCFLRIYGQVPLGAWSDHLRYNTAVNLAVTTDKIYSSTGASLLVYDKKHSELKSMSKINGLSETGISTLAWSEKAKTLITAYLTANIDLIHDNTIYNLPDISIKSLPVKKIISRIRTAGKYAYCCTSFGIVLIDLEKKEIHDTWRPGPDADYNQVFDVAFGNGRVYAATDNGVWFADLKTSGLSYFGNWSLLNAIPEPDIKCTLLFFSSGTLYVNVSHSDERGDEIFSVRDKATIFSSLPQISNLSIDSASAGFTITSPGMMRYFKSDGSHSLTISSFGWGSPNLCQSVLENDYIWLADKDYGLIMVDKSNNFIILTLTGPSSNEIANTISYSGKTIICGGGTDDSWNNLLRPFMVSVYENNRFSNFASNSAYDAMRVCFEPDNNSHFFVSSWGYGLFEYNNNTLIKNYNALNSPLGNGTVPVTAIKIWGLAMDQSKNLWITQSDTPENIKILKPDGNWIIYPININTQVIGDIIATSSGQKWIILPGGNGLFIIDDNNTPEIFSDDNSRKLKITDSDNNEINSVFSMAEDLEGNIWIGTDRGPVVYNKPTQIFAEEVKGYRIKIPRNDGSGLADYMLGNESITSIAIDGANRKWLGTKNSGVYLISSESTSIIKYYNELNSPLFSDSIASVSVDNVTGEVWFATSKGLLSVRELAIQGKQTFDNVYSFPNPVREDYQGDVTITGLIKDTQIKITDVSGNLVYETMSEGGQASWDLTTYKGRRIKTGVYLIFCSDNDSSESYVTKILVIRK